MGNPARSSNTSGFISSDAASPVHHFRSRRGGRRIRCCERLIPSARVRDFLWKIKWAFPIVLTTVLGGVLAALFENLPMPKDGSRRQSVAQIVKDLNILSILKRTPKFPLSVFKNYGGSVVLLMSQILYPKVPLFLRSPTSFIASNVPTIAAIEQDAFDVMPVLNSLTKKRYFRIFKIDLNAKCPFWFRDNVCSSSSDSCTVCECGDDNVPIAWKEKPTENFVNRELDTEISGWGGHLSDQTSLDELSGFSDFFAKDVQPMRFDAISDEHLKAASYVDLSLNKPKNTGYKRSPIWAYIYNENCIGDSPGNPLAKQLPHDPNLGDQCQEELSFYRILSGIQSVISVLVAENFYFYPEPSWLTHISSALSLKNLASPGDSDAVLLSATPEYNLQFYLQSFAAYPERLQSLYFTFSILIRTICHARPILEKCGCDTGLPTEAEQTRKNLESLLEATGLSSSCRDQYMQKPIFARKSSLALRQFRNITRIMDCVECESCRLHAKVKVLALYLSLKATSEPFGLDAMERNELIALMNAASYFGEAILAVKRFRQRVLLINVLWFLGVFATICCCIWLLKKLAKRRLASCNCLSAWARLRVQWLTKTKLK